MTNKFLIPLKIQSKMKQDKDFVPEYSPFSSFSKVDSSKQFSWKNNIDLLKRYLYGNHFQYCKEFVSKHSVLKIIETNILQPYQLVQLARCAYFNQQYPSALILINQIIQRQSFYFNWKSTIMKEYRMMRLQILFMMQWQNQTFDLKNEIIDLTDLITTLKDHWDRKIINNLKYYERIMKPQFIKEYKRQCEKIDLDPVTLRELRDCLKYPTVMNENEAYCELVPKIWLQKVINYFSSQRRKEVFPPPPFTELQIAFISVDVKIEYKGLQFYKHASKCRVPKATFLKITSLLSLTDFKKVSTKESQRSQSLIKSISNDRSRFAQFNRSRRGHRGLQNYQSSCYMNSGLQCLHKTVLLRDYFQALQINGKEFSDPAFLQSYKLLNTELSSDNAQPLSPMFIKQAIERKNALFAGNEQHDSCELVNTVINSLHESLSIPKSKQNQLCIDLNQLGNDDQILAMHKKKDEIIAKSKMDDIFFGRYKITYQCTKCKNEQILFQKFSTIYLQNNKKKEFSMIDALKEISRPIVLSGDNVWECHKCNENYSTEHKIEIYEVNKIIIFCIKKSPEDYYSVRYNSIPEILDDSNGGQYLGSKNNKKYRLYGVINHYGSLRSGHYRAYCLQDNEWWYYNDSVVQKEVDNRYIFCGTYMLFYQLIQN